MSDDTHVKLLIIGSGPAGYTAAVYGARAMLNPMLIQGMQPGGQLTITTEVENWPGETEIQGPDLMVKMESHARAMGAEVVTDIVTKLDLGRRPFTAECDSGARITADALNNLKQRGLVCKVWGEAPGFSFGTSGPFRSAN